MPFVDLFHQRFTKHIMFHQNRHSFSLKFFLHLQKQNARGEFPVYVRIMYNREKAELFTKQTVNDPKQWDDHSQRLLIAKSPINTALARMQGELQMVFDQLFFNKKRVTAAIIKSQYLGRNEESPLLKAYMDEFYKEHILGSKDLSEGTVKNYRATINHVNSFLTSTSRNRILLCEIDERFVRKLDQFLSATSANKQGTLRKNTVNKYQTKFKALLNVARKEGHLEKCPYAFFKLKNEPTGRTFLTEKELSILQKHSLGGNESLIRVRDIFMFSVYTGLRFNDAINLKASNIEFDGKKHWIVLRMQKTGEALRIPMLKKAVDIYEKYLVEQTITGNVLPRISNQKLNVYLKVIAGLCGFNKTLTHHCARHTNATTIFLSNGVPLEVVSRQLGHTSIRSTQVYARITNEMLSGAVDKIDHLLS